VALVGRIEQILEFRLHFSASHLSAQRDGNQRLVDIGDQLFDSIDVVANQNTVALIAIDLPSTITIR
jgi:hypothetical protein